MTIVLNSMSQRLLASISLSFFSGDSSFHLEWELFHCLPILCDSFSLFLHISLLCFDSLLCGWLTVVSSVGMESVVQSLWSPYLDALGMLFNQFMLVLLLYLWFAYRWLICWWVLPSGWMTITTMNKSCMQAEESENTQKTKWSTASILPYHISNSNIKLANFSKSAKQPPSLAVWLGWGWEWWERKCRQL